MSNSELEKGLFTDLEDLDRKEIEQNVNDFERQISHARALESGFYFL